jgi:GntR family transcriptional regulator, transcriptional repressor for pyruvate dehydrogenase complex
MHDEVRVQCSMHLRRSIDAVTKSLSAGVLDGKGKVDLVALPRRRATFEAIEAIQDQIRRGNLRPGECLPSERELSEALGVSRPTVREAVQALAAMNILDVRHGSGTFVASLNIGEVLMPLRFALELTMPAFDHLFEVRVQLEPLAAELAAKRATKEQLRGIQAALTRLNKRGHTTEERVDLDIALHSQIVAASQNDLLITLIGSLEVLARRSRQLTIAVPGVAARARKEHGEIVDAIVARQPAVAREAMSAHLTAVHQLAEAHRAHPVSKAEGRSPRGGAQGPTFKMIDR